MQAYIDTYTTHTYTYTYNNMCKLSNAQANILKA